MAQPRNQSDLVQTYTSLIQQERENIARSLEAIEEYSEKLRLACADARVRLIGRS